MFDFSVSVTESTCDHQLSPAKSTLSCGDVGDESILATSPRISKESSASPNHIKDNEPDPVVPADVVLGSVESNKLETVVADSRLLSITFSSPKHGLSSGLSSVSETTSELADPVAVDLPSDDAAAPLSNVEELPSGSNPPASLVKIDSGGTPILNKPGEDNRFNSGNSTSVPTD
ncbi:unnamed protein product [Echinostoma caproni]|uniref:Uncharacterized protein n=1 Tax=Echinostoma caproni TaxID=27848 RepID=A0A183AZA2_9TREM|nr:unnamed protein product [Echinostoma caproni]